MNTNTPQTKTQAYNEDLIKRLIAADLDVPVETVAIIVTYIDPVYPDAFTITACYAK